jgi:hypothetical protein
MFPKKELYMYKYLHLTYNALCNFQPYKLLRMIMLYLQIDFFCFSLRKIT